MKSKSYYYEFYMLNFSLSYFQLNLFSRNSRSFFKSTKIIWDKDCHFPHNTVISLSLICTFLKSYLQADFNTLNLCVQVRLSSFKNFIFLVLWSKYHQKYIWKASQFWFSKRISKILWDICYIAYTRRYHWIWQQPA